MDFKSGAELPEQYATRGITISEVTKQRECDLTGVPMENIETRMKDVLAVMRSSAAPSLREPVTSIDNLIGGESTRMEKRRRKGTPILGGVLDRAVTYAMAALEVNTPVELIVAAPTAGSPGIVSGLLLALQEEYGLGDDLVADGLSATSAVRYLATRSAIVSGAVGGCQVEAGVACVMTAAAAVELTGGTPAQGLDTASVAPMNLLGPIRDPVGGLVECPCQNRDGVGATNALVCAETAFSGIRQLTPLDKALETMHAVGRELPLELREAALGGCVATSSGYRMGYYAQKA